MRDLSRRSVLVGAFAGAGALVASAPAAYASAPPNPVPVKIATAPDVEAVKLAMDAKGQSSYVAGCISNMVYNKGSIYYGYGDWTLNSGSTTGLNTTISRFNPSDGSFTHEMVYNAESTESIRKLGSTLYFPNIDPSDNRPSSFASGTNGSFKAAPGGVPAEHIFDVVDGARFGHFIIAGSASFDGQPHAALWETFDYGATWSVLYRERSSVKSTGYERYYWLGRIGTSIYFRADWGDLSLPYAPMRRYNLITKTFSTLDDSVLPSGYDPATMTYVGQLPTLGIYPSQSKRVVSKGGCLYFNEFDRLMVFNGSRAVPVSGVGRVEVLSVSDTGALYATGFDAQEKLWLYKVEGSTATPVVRMWACSAFVVIGSTVYLSRFDSGIYSRQIPA